jgi:hypothetical protein
MKGKRMRTSLVITALVQASLLALVAAKPVQSKPSHHRALEARKVNDRLIDGMKAFANTRYSGWAMIIQFIGSLNRMPDNTGMRAEYARRGYIHASRRAWRSQQRDKRG